MSDLFFAVEAAERLPYEFLSVKEFKRWLDTQIPKTAGEDARMCITPDEGWVGLSPKLIFKYKRAKTESEKKDDAEKVEALIHYELRNLENLKRKYPDHAK